MRLLVTGGCGFIGSNFLRYILEHYHPAFVTNVDLLTDPAAIANVEGLAERYGERYEFLRADIADARALEALFHKHAFYAIVNFAVESRLADRFTHTNVTGTEVLLDLARRHGVRRLIQISTAKVYGSLAEGEAPFTEVSPPRPGLPYAASRAEADSLVLAAHREHGQETAVIRASNAYGPFQPPDRLIPKMITHALRGERLPVHGDGLQSRGWMDVEDLCRAIFAVLLEGRPGEIYNAGGDSELCTLEIARQIAARLGRGGEAIELVADRPGNDRRRVINGSKIRAQLGFKPLHPFEEGLGGTIDWYLRNRAWWEPLLDHAEP